MQLSKDLSPTKQEHFITIKRSGPFDFFWVCSCGNLESYSSTYGNIKLSVTSHLIAANVIVVDPTIVSKDELL